MYREWSYTTRSANPPRIFTQKKTIGSSKQIQNKDIIRYARCVCECRIAICLYIVCLLSESICTCVRILHRVRVWLPDGIDSSFWSFKPSLKRKHNIFSLQSRTFGASRSSRRDIIRSHVCCMCYGVLFLVFCWRSHERGSLFLVFILKTISIKQYSSYRKMLIRGNCVSVWRKFVVSGSLNVLLDKITTPDIISQTQKKEFGVKSAKRERKRGRRYWKSHTGAPKA